MGILELLGKNIFSDYSSRDLADFALSSYSKHEIAEILSGSSDRKSNSYKSAYRQAGLYKQGIRKPGKEFSNRLRNSLARDEAATRRASSNLNSARKIRFVGYVQVSRDKRKRVIETILQPSDLRDIANQDNEMDAIQEFLFIYGLDDATASDYTVS